MYHRLTQLVQTRNPILAVPHHNKPVHCLWGQKTHKITPIQYEKTIQKTSLCENNFDRGTIKHYCPGLNKKILLK